MIFARLNTTGFQFTQTGVALNLAHAGHGDGFDNARLFGDPAGLRSWQIKIGALPHSEIAPLIEGKTRAAYLYDFYLASKAAGDLPFWVKDPYDGLLYLSSFPDASLGYDILASKVYGAGLSIRQRRVAAVSSPILDVNRTALGAQAWKAPGGTSLLLASNKTLAPGETLIVGLAAINGSGWAFGSRFAGYNVPADIFPDGTTPRTNLFRFKNRTANAITGDITVVVEGHTFTQAYAAFASKYELLTNSPFDLTAHAAGSSTTANSGDTATLSQADELVIGCTGIQGPGGDTAPTIASGSEANELGQRAGTAGGDADSNCTIVESFGTVSSDAPANAALTLGVSRAWQSSVVAYLIG